MKKCLAAILALLLSLAGIGALAEIEVDTTQLTTPFDFGFNDFKTAVDFWHQNLSTASWSGWNAPEELGDGFFANRYTVEEVIDVAAVSKGDEVYAIMMAYTLDASTEDSVSKSYEMGNVTGQELALLLSATETPGITMENMQGFTDFIASLEDGSFAEDVQTAWTSVMNLSGDSASAPLNGNTLSSRIVLSEAEQSGRFNIAYTPEDYVF